MTSRAEPVVDAAVVDTAGAESAAARARALRRVQAPLEIVHPRRRSAGLRGYSLRTMALVCGLVVTAWLLFVFGTALARTEAIEAEADEQRARNAGLVERLELGRQEIVLIQSERFLSIHARAFGMGETGERPFALMPGAAAPPSIVPLGAEAAVEDPPTPLEEWLDLIFG